MVVDATFPYKTSRECHEDALYVCSLKLVDPSLYAKSEEKSGKDYATLVLYAKRFEDLPIVSRIGDIIRVHRASIRLYNGHRQFNANLYYNSSWAIFATESTDGDNKPFSHSSKKFTFEKHETSVLNSLKRWAQKYLGQYSIAGDMTSPLKTASEQRGDFDVVAKVVSVFEMDEYTYELALRDTSLPSNHPPVSILVLRLKFPHIMVGDVVKVRSAAFDVTSSQKMMLVLSHYSNIMKFIGSSKMAKEINSKVQTADGGSFDQSLVASAKILPRAVTISEVLPQHRGLPLLTLYDLFHTDQDTGMAEGQVFRTRFFVAGIQPPDVREWV